MLSNVYCYNYFWGKSLLFFVGLGWVNVRGFLSEYGVYGESSFDINMY